MTWPSYNDQWAPALWIIGIGSQYPKHLISAEDLETFATQHYDLRNEG
jgi:hypothetical protein